MLHKPTLAVMQWLAVLIAALVPLRSLADGLPLRNGRYPGPVLEFELTLEQKQVIDHFRTCHLERFQQMNVFTPYVFARSADQANVVKSKVGFVPARFEVYETWRGFNDAGPHWNLVLRYSESRIEVPLDLLLPDRKAAQAHAEQGWEPFNPCFPGLQER